MDHVKANPERFTAQALARYLRALHRRPVSAVSVLPLAGGKQGDKEYGYGIPLRIAYELDGRPHRAVLETVRPGQFGHEHMADRAQLMLWAHRAFADLPRHVPSVDVGVVRKSGELVPLGDAEEFFMLAEFVDGKEYAADLLRLRDGGTMGERDEARSHALCDYLVSIHRVAGPDPGLYVRRIRELLGLGECIFGVVDSYPSDGPVAHETLEEIERRCLAWRWRLKPRAHRLRQVHGDFHPWNILFREGTDFTVLDRSRGEWGDPADDVACLTLNHLFFSLQRSQKLEGDFERLFMRFWSRYLEGSADAEMLEVVAPFYAFRGLVMANPVWYPALDGLVREKMIRFTLNVLAEERFDPARANAYCDG
jgi:aminoglycoside phosphotransferase (APT) family kinase protein